MSKSDISKESEFIISRAGKNFRNSEKIPEYSEIFPELFSENPSFRRIPEISPVLIISLFPRILNFHGILFCFNPLHVFRSCFQKLA